MLKNFYASCFGLTPAFRRNSLLKCVSSQKIQ